MTIVLFDDEVHVHYGFGALIATDEVDYPPEHSAACFGQANGLLGAGVPGALSFMFGLHTGAEPLRVEWHDAAPAVGDEWEDVVEASFTAATTNASISCFDDFHEVTLPATGPLRARFSARGMDAANDLDTRMDEPAPDQYLVQLWPAEPAADAIVRQTSAIAAYWHGTTQRA